jgi:hypothetical protein
VRIWIGRNHQRQRSAAPRSDVALDHFGKELSQRQAEASSGSPRVRNQSGIYSQGEMNVGNPRGHARILTPAQMATGRPHAQRAVRF